MSEFREDNLTDWAAALTYYGILSVFPALLVLLSLLGLIGSSATQPLLDNLADVAPGPAQEILTSAIQNLQESQGAAGILFIVGLAGAIWSASGYVAAFIRASNAIYDVDEAGRLEDAPAARGAHAGSRAPALVCAVAVVVTGGQADKAGDCSASAGRCHRLGHRQWPVLVVLESFMFALLYWAAPTSSSLASAGSVPAVSSP